MARPADRMPNQGNDVDYEDDGTRRARTEPLASSDGNGTAIAALVIGLLAATFAFLIVTLPAGIVFGLIAIVLGAIGIGKANKLGGLHKGLAITGLVSGLLGLIVAGLAIFASVNLFQEGQQELESNTELQQQIDELQQQIEDTSQG